MIYFYEQAVSCYNKRCCCQTPVREGKFGVGQCSPGKILWSCPCLLVILCCPISRDVCSRMSDILLICRSSLACGSKVVVRAGDVRTSSFTLVTAISSSILIWVDIETTYLICHLRRQPTVAVIWLIIKNNDCDIINAYIYIILMATICSFHHTAHSSYTFTFNIQIPGTSIYNIQISGIR